MLMRADAQTVELLTNSRRDAFLACPQRHRFAYVEQVVPLVTPSALAFGQAWHEVLEGYWRARWCDLDVRSDRVMTHVAAKGDPYHAAAIEHMLKAYRNAWDPVECDVVSVEQEFRLPLRHPNVNRAIPRWKLAGKLDLVIRLRETGLTMLVEHKSTSEDAGPGSKYREALLRDSQVTGYMHAARAAGHDVSGCIYDVCEKPDITPRKATPMDARRYTKDNVLYKNQRESDESIQEFVARIWSKPVEVHKILVSRLDSELARFRGDAYSVARTMDAVAKLDTAPRNYHACRDYGRSCAYVDVCTGTASLDDPERFRRKTRRHEELSGDE